MHLKLLSLALAAAMLPACDRTVSVTPDASAEVPDQQSSPAADTTGARKLKTGEWLQDATYGWVHPLGGPKAALLTVEFGSAAEPGLREESLRELVTQRLLPSAMRDGYLAARLWENRSKTSVGPLKFSSSESWTFERDAGRQWRQTAGPKIDWKIVTQELVANPKLHLNVAAKFIQKKWDSGDYRLEMHTVAFPDLSPREAMAETVQLLASITNCDLDAGLQPSFLSDAKLNAVGVYAYPEQKRDLLDIVPFVHFDLGRIDGRWTCDRQSMLDNVEKLDWSDRKNWDDLIR